MRVQAPPGMVYVPAGVFVMGCADHEVLRDDVHGKPDYLAWSRPQRVVHLDAFFADIHPVTNRQYREFVLATGHPVPQDASPPDYCGRSPYSWDMEGATYMPGTDDFPVTCVSWFDAVAYCRWVGKRLPTEAEWERLARGCDGRPYPWGWEPVLAGRAHTHRDDQSVAYHPVGDLVPVYAMDAGASPEGCLDLLGNAEEWCADWFGARWYRRMPAENPTGPPRGRFRSCRGCGRFWARPHSALRDRYDPQTADRGIGFRCVRSA